MTTDLAAQSNPPLLLGSGGSAGPLPGISPGEIKVDSHLEHLGENARTQFPAVVGLRAPFPCWLWAGCYSQIPKAAHIYMAYTIFSCQPYNGTCSRFKSLCLSFLSPAREISLLSRAFMRSSVPGNISNPTAVVGGWYLIPSQI